MSTTEATLKGVCLTLLDETFDQVEGMYLYKNESLLLSLNAISAHKASERCGSASSIAAHTFHLLFYLDELERAANQEPTANIDWNESWKVSSVDDAQWEALKARVRQTYASVHDRIERFELWENKYAVADLMLAIVHTAYHLGAIRATLAATEPGEVISPTSLSE
jgi:hypothetical protein